ncbi:UNVERIFIED_ORG: DNA-binding transcriptional regulator of glucitol operon [Enterobacter sp. JUb101]|nr:DNA-binding transcriptional regulator of glucitol operon [Lelliottia amnigena]
MMKKIVMVGALMALTGCVQVDNYQDVVKHPVPADLAGYWQSKGPQSKMVSPQAIATLVVTKEGDTLDCRQWQRVVAVPGKIMLRSDDFYNVTRKLDVYQLEREGNTLEYDGMELQRVDRPTVECAQYLTKNPLESTLP